MVVTESTDELIHRLYSGSWTLKWDAIVKLGAPSLETLCGALCHPSARGRREAATALGKIGSPLAIAALSDALTNEAWGVRWAVAEALGEIRDSRALEALEDASIRAAVAESLGKIGDGRAQDRLAVLLCDGDPLVRWHAAAALGRIGGPQTVDRLCEATGNAQEQPYVRASIAAALGEIGDLRAAEALCGALSHRDADLARAASESLDRMGDQHALPRKLLLCREMPLRKRVSALNTLFARRERHSRFRGWYYYAGFDARRYCREALGGADSSVRQGAEEMLAYLGNPLLVPADSQGASGKETLLRMAAAGPESTPPEELLRASDSQAQAESGKRGPLSWLRKQFR